MNEPKPDEPPAKKINYPMSACVVKYTALPDKHENNDPPPPCNGWCKREVVAPDGKTIESKVFPWLDETKGKKVYVGVHPQSGKPVTAEHLKFDSPYYITKIEQAPKYDDNGHMVRQWYNEDGEGVETPDDPQNPPKGFTSKIQYAFEFAVGVDAQTWIAEHLFRLAANAVPNLSKLANYGGHIVNNTGNLVHLMAMATQKEQPGNVEGEVDGP